MLSLKLPHTLRFCTHTQAQNYFSHPDRNPSFIINKFFPLSSRPTQQPFLQQNQPSLNTHTHTFVDTDMLGDIHNARQSIAQTTSAAFWVVYACVWACVFGEPDSLRFQISKSVCEEGWHGKEKKQEESEKGWESMRTSEVVLHILMSSLLEREPWDPSYSQVCACVFDLCIYDGSLPVCLLLPGHSDSIGDKQVDENTLFPSGATVRVCVRMRVCVHVCVYASQRWRIMKTNYHSKKN